MKSGLRHVCAVGPGGLVVCRPAWVEERGRGREEEEGGRTEEGEKGGGREERREDGRSEEGEEGGEEGKEGGGQVGGGGRWEDGSSLVSLGNTVLGPNWEIFRLRWVMKDLIFSSTPVKIKSKLKYPGTKASTLSVVQVVT
ncbi:hypothetical protein B0H10DRAFT_1953508 [Mycena sp. CBHHK59/15]|nr:hypothetical protein B0H10DRAFT_1953508 [Mycena sp. CBHHK59/15]